MPFFELSLPDTYANTDGLVTSLKTAIAEAFGSDDKPMKPDKVGHFVNYYSGRHDRPGRPILVRLTAVDLPGRREKLRSIVEKVVAENDEVTRFESKDDKHVDLIPTWIPDEDWVAA